MASGADTPVIVSVFEQEARASDCENSALQGDACVYWNSYCQIGAIEGSCEGNVGFLNNQCPASCEVALCSSRVPTFPAEVSSLKSAWAEMAAQNSDIRAIFDWETKIDDDPCSRCVNVDNLLATHRMHSCSIFWLSQIIHRQI